MLLLFLSVMVLLKNFITSLAGKEQIPVRLELYIWHFVCRDCGVWTHQKYFADSFS